MSKGHGDVTVAARSESIQQVKQELQGRLPRGPFEFSDDIGFDSITAGSEESPAVVRRMKAAIQRDARHASAGSVYLRRFGMSQTMRSIYDGGRQIIDGGGE